MLKDINKNIMSLLRPRALKRLLGKRELLNHLISKMASPYPQHIILYGPPGVGKTYSCKTCIRRS